MLIQDGKLFFPAPVLCRPQPRLRIEKHQHDQREQKQEPDKGSKSVHVSLTVILPFNVQILQVSSLQVNFDRDYLYGSAFTETRRLLARKPFIRVLMSGLRSSSVCFSPSIISTFSK